MKKVIASLILCSTAFFANADQKMPKTLDFNDRGTVSVCLAAMQSVMSTEAGSYMNLTKEEYLVIQNKYRLLEDVALNADVFPIPQVIYDYLDVEYGRYFQLVSLAQQCANQYK